MTELTTYAWWILAFFVLGYLLIIFEYVTEVSKTTVALLMAVVCWAIQFSDPSLSYQEHHHILTEHLGTVSEVVIFLLGALAIVEVISSHNGFVLITRVIPLGSLVVLLWVVGVVTFFASAVLDNLTTTVVMVTMLRKLVKNGEDRLLLGGAVVIAANAGGAWTPIGDVTTTMLWIGGQITPLGVVAALSIPSLVCLVVSLLCLSYQLRGTSNHAVRVAGCEESIQDIGAPYSTAILFVGVGSLIFVPIFKGLTGLPPIMGMLLGLGVLWLVTDLLHRRYHDRTHLRIPAVLSRVDLAGVLFFLGILLAVDTLDTTGLLVTFSSWISSVLPNPSWTAMVIGLASAVVDNVPLVAASMRMYPVADVPAGSFFWHQIAFAAGTGGSILVIGSAAGIAFMGMEGVSFAWWVRRVSLAALLGYLAGFGTHLILSPYTG